MNRKQKDAIGDAIFQAVLGLLVLMLIVNITISRMPKEDAPETTGYTTSAVTTSPSIFIEETETPTTEDTEATEVTEATLPPVILYNIPLDADLQMHIIAEANTHGIDPTIIMAMAYKESTYNPNAIGDGGNSFGLLQIQPRWHTSRMNKLGCTDLMNPFDNVSVAVDYLSEMLDRYDGDIAKALVAYNAGHYNGTITDYARIVIATAQEISGDTYVLFR